MITHRLVSFIVSTLNRAMELFGGPRDPVTGRLVNHWLHLHWSNENEDHNGHPKGFPWKARFWLHSCIGKQRTFRLESVLGKFRLGADIGISSDYENDLTGHISIPLLTLHWGAEGIWPKWFRDRWERRYGYNERELSLRFFDYGVWWHLWADPNNWSSKTPRWRDGSWHYLDTLLGKSVYSSESIAGADVLIPMPEGAYPATVKLTLDTWKRPRWLARTLRRASVDMKTPIPHEGKGENSWDCGKDGLYGLSTCADTFEEAISKTTESALKSRRRYDGDVMAKYPAPERIENV